MATIKEQRTRADKRVGQALLTIAQCVRQIVQHARAAHMDDDVWLAVAETYAKAEVKSFQERLRAVPLHDLPLDMIGEAVTLNRHITELLESWEAFTKLHSPPEFVRAMEAIAAEIQSTETRLEDLISEI